MLSPSKTVKPIFYWKLNSDWLTNTDEMGTNNMKSTWPTPVPRVGDSTPPIFHLLVLGVGVGGNANFSVFRYQHVRISNEKLWHWGSEPTRGPNANGFASQWKIGFRGDVKFPHIVECQKPSGKHWKPIQETYATKHIRPFAPSVVGIESLCIV